MIDKKNDASRLKFILRAGFLLAVFFGLPAITLAASPMADEDLALTHFNLDGDKPASNINIDAKSLTYGTQQKMYADSLLAQFINTQIDSTAMKQVEKVVASYSDITAGPSAVDGKFEFFALAVPAAELLDIAFKAPKLVTSDDLFGLDLLKVGNNTYIIEGSAGSVELYEVTGVANIRVKASSGTAYTAPLGLFSPR